MFNYDIASADAEIKLLSKVRFLCKDTIEAGAQLDDAEVLFCIELEGDADTFGIVKLAAAQALDVIARDDAKIQKRIETLELKIDGPALSKELRAHADSLRAQVATALAKLEAEEDEEDEDGMFDIAQIANDDFSLREIVRNQAAQD